MDWQSYLTQIGYPEISSINIYQPSFLKELSDMMKNVPVEDWKTFLSAGSSLTILQLI